MEDSFLVQIFFKNWQRKAVALLSAFFLWFLVNSSITETKTIPNVPIRIINLPSDKTIVGLLPNRLLSKRVTLTLSGRKDVIQEIEPGDLEVLLDVSTADSDEWVVKITKKNLVSLNPSIDLYHHITQVEHSEFVLKLSPLVTAKIPIKIVTPIGEPPEGYEFLDIWPQQLMQTVSGPQEEIQILKMEGLKLSLNLNDISKTELDSLSAQQSFNYEGEISYFVPDKWKKIGISFNHNALEEINDPEADKLHIDFLRKDFLKVSDKIPIRIFYPFKNSKHLNPSSHPLAIDNPIEQENDITLLSAQLYVKDVSKLFLEIIRQNLEIAIVAAPKNERELLQWSLEIIDPHELEDMYVAYMTSKGSVNKKHESLLRSRFKDYARRLHLFTASGKKLELEAILGSQNIRVNVLK